MLSMSRCLVDDVEVYRSTRLRLISFTISYYFPFLFNPVARESCPHIFDFTPPPQHSYLHVQTSTRLSLSIYKGIRLYTDVYVRNKVEEDRILTSTGHTNVMTGGVRFGLCTRRRGRWWSCSRRWRQGGNEEGGQGGPLEAQYPEARCAFTPMSLQLLPPPLPPPRPERVRIRQPTKFTYLRQS